MSFKQLTDLDLLQNEVQNAVVHQLMSPPVDPVEGQIYYNLSDKSLYIFDGNAWKACHDANFVHNQTLASATWIVDHNLGKLPSVTIIDSANDEVFGEVKHDTINKATISFSAAFSGKAFFN